MIEEITVNLPGYGTLTGEFEHNDHGYFCILINGLRWDYPRWGVQAAKETPEAAATGLLRYAELILAQ